MLGTCVAGSKPKLASVEVGKFEVVVVDKLEYLRKLPIRAMSRPFENQRKATAQVTIICNLQQATEQSGKEQLVLSNQSTTRRVPPIGGLPR